MYIQGVGAETFAKEQGIKIVHPNYFYIENRYQSSNRIQDKEKTQLDHDGKTTLYDPHIKPELPFLLD